MALGGSQSHCRLCDGWCAGEPPERSAGAPRHSDRRGSRKIHKVRSPRTFTKPAESSDFCMGALRPAAWGTWGECARIPAPKMNHWRSEDLNHTADCVAGRAGHCRLCDGWCGGEQRERSAGAPRHSDRRGSRKIHKVRSPRTFTNPCQSHSWELTDRNPEILEPLAPHRRCDAAPTVQEFPGFGRLAPRNDFLVMTHPSAWGCGWHACHCAC